MTFLEAQERTLDEFRTNIVEPSGFKVVKVHTIRSHSGVGVRNHCDWTCGHYRGPLTYGDCYGRCQACAQCVVDGAPMPRDGNDDMA
ncbi:hypothetical protein OC861_006265, partial [Tilletia horrida]